MWCTGTGTTHTTRMQMINKVLWVFGPRNITINVLACQLNNRWELGKEISGNYFARLEASWLKPICILHQLDTYTSTKLSAINHFSLAF